MSAPHPVNLIEEILDSGGIAASGVALILPKGKKGRPTNPAQIRAWMQTGIMTPSGHRLILESAWIGGRRLTTRAALARFIAAQNLDASGPHPL